MSKPVAWINGRNSTIVGKKSVRRDTNKSLIKVTSIEISNKTEQLLVEMDDFEFYQAD